MKIINLNRKWQHDCKQCTFVGHISGLDLYFCREPEGYIEYVARYGNHGEQYYSGYFDKRVEIHPMDDDYTKTIVACASYISSALKESRK